MDTAELGMDKVYWRKKKDNYQIRSHLVLCKFKKKYIVFIFNGFSISNWVKDINSFTEIGYFHCFIYILVVCFRITQMHSNTHSRPINDTNTILLSIQDQMLIYLLHEQSILYKPQDNIHVRTCTSMTKKSFTLFKSERLKSSSVLVLPSSFLRSWVLEQI